MNTKRKKTAKRLFFFSMLFGILFSVLPGNALFDSGDASPVNRSDLPAGDNSPASLESSAIAGYVFHSDDGKTLPYYHVFVEGEHFIGKNTSTNSTGCYSLRIPEGEFTVVVEDLQNVEIYRTSVVIGANETKRFDLPVDTEKAENSHIGGVVKNSDNGKGLGEVDVTLISTYPKVQVLSVKTDEDGSYNFTVTSGSYKVEYRLSEELRHTRTFNIHWGEKKTFNNTFMPESEAPEEEDFLKDLLSAVKEKWYYLLGIVITIFMGIIVLNLLPIIINRLFRRAKGYCSEEFILLVRRFIRSMIMITILLLEIYFLGFYFKFIDTNIWDNINPNIINLYFIVFIIYLIMILRAMITDFVKFASTKRDKSVKKIVKGEKFSLKNLVYLPTRQLKQAQPILRYLVLVLGILVILSTILSMFGAKRSMSSSVANFLSENVNYLYFIAILILVAWLLKRMLTIIFDDMAKRAKKIHPATVILAGKGLKGFLIAFTSMIVLVAILQMAELGEISSVILSIAIVSIGVVSAISSTGGINNLLTGMAVQAFRPVDIGDRIRIGENIIGDVVEISNISVKIRNLEKEIVNIPHNEILLNTLVNYTKSVPVALTISATIGYDTAHEDVEYLMKEAAKKTTGVVSAPPPETVLVEMHDYYIKYELKAYINNVKRMRKIKSELIRKCHTLFYKNGVEILSPAYFVKRNEIGPSDDEMKKFVRSKVKMKKRSKKKKETGSPESKGEENIPQKEVEKQS